MKDAGEEIEDKRMKEWKKMMEGEDVINLNKYMIKNICGSFFIMNIDKQSNLQRLAV